MSTPKPSLTRMKTIGLTRMLSASSISLEPINLRLKKTKNKLPTNQMKRSWRKNISKNKVNQTRKMIRQTTLRSIRMKKQWKSMWKKI